MKKVIEVQEYYLNLSKGYYYVCYICNDKLDEVSKLIALVQRLEYTDEYVGCLGASYICKNPKCEEYWRLKYC